MKNGSITTPDWKLLITMLSRFQFYHETELQAGYRPLSGKREKNSNMSQQSFSKIQRNDIRNILQNI